MKKSIITKKGDDGTTGLLDHSRVKKYDLRPETYGTLDEAAAFLGLVRAKTDLQLTRETIYTLQNHIYLINSELACPADRLSLLKNTLTQTHIDRLEELCYTIESQLQLPSKFVLYGQSELSAFLDISRAVVRRAERRLVEMQKTDPVNNEHIPPYINRLSDALFLLARYEEYAHDIPYAHPDGSH